MEIETVRFDSNLRIRLHGDIDAEAGASLAEAFSGALAMDGITMVSLDLSSVPSSTSLGIGKMINFYKALKERGVQMEIRGISPSLLEQFNEIHLDRIFIIFKNRG
jgi:anti-sigma B factor antagonist